jgi:hypothetical protein
MVLRISQERHNHDISLFSQQASSIVNLPQICIAIRNMGRIFYVVMMITLHVTSSQHQVFPD